MSSIEMEEPEKIRSDAIEGALELLQNDEVNEVVSSTFFGDARQKLTREKLEKVIVAKPDKYAKTSLARAISSFGRGRLYPGKVTLYRPFFEEFNIRIGPDQTAASLGLPMGQRRIIILLHELSHLTRKYIDVFQFVGKHYFDQPIYDQCTINKRIYDAWHAKKDID